MPRPIRDSALQRMKGTFKSSSGLLLPQIERHVMRASANHVDTERDPTWMHPSDMAKADWCGRHDYYRMIGTEPGRSTSANPSFRMTNVFAEGHAIHGKYQTWLWEMGVLVGNWKCRECGHYWFAMSPSECQFCRSERIHYMEYTLQHQSYRVQGHADAGVHLTDDKALVEIKSIGIRTLAFEAPRLYNRYLDGEKPEDIWMSINHPFGSHMKQGQLYLWMAWPAYEQIIFIYESKFHQQTKEFVVEYNKRLIEPLLVTAKDVAQGIRAGIEPDRPEWAVDPVTKACSSCPYRNTCWQLGGSTRAHQDQDAAPTKLKRSSAANRRRALRPA